MIASARSSLPCLQEGRFKVWTEAIDIAVLWGLGQQFSDSAARHQHFCSARVLPFCSGNLTLRSDSFSLSSESVRQPWPDSHPLPSAAWVRSVVCSWVQTDIPDKQRRRSKIVGKLGKRVAEGEWDRRIRNSRQFSATYWSPFLPGLYDEFEASLGFMGPCYKQG